MESFLLGDSHVRVRLSFVRADTVKFFGSEIKIEMTAFNFVYAIKI